MVGGGWRGLWRCRGVVGRGGSDRLYDRNRLDIKTISSLWPNGYRSSLVIICFKIGNRIHIRIRISITTDTSISISTSMSTRISIRIITSTSICINIRSSI